MRVDLPSQFQQKATPPVGRGGNCVPVPGSAVGSAVRRGRASLATAGSLAGAGVARAKRWCVLGLS
jgi:hypothetical protein